MEHISASQIGMYNRCPRQYEYRYIEKIVAPPGIALLVGGSVHRSIEAAMRRKAESRSNLTPGEVADIAADAFDSQLSERDVLLTKDEQSLGRTNAIGQAIDRVCAVARYWSVAVQTEYQPAAPEDVEQEFSIPMPSIGTRYSGIIDLIDERDLIVDWKTGRRKRSYRELQTSVQFTGYSIAVERKTKRRPMIVVEQILDRATGIDRTSLAFDKSPLDYEVFAKRVAATVTAIRKGVFPPCDPGSWQCSSKWCGYASQCPYYVPGE